MSTNYSTWAESVRKDPFIKVYLDYGKTYDLCLVASSIFLLIINTMMSYVVSKFLSKRKQRGDLTTIEATNTNQNSSNRVNL